MQNNAVLDSLIKKSFMYVTPPKTYQVRGIRHCSNPRCEQISFKNRDGNACKNFMLLRETMKRGNDPPFHLDTHYHAQETSVFTLNEAKKKAKQSNERPRNVQSPESQRNAPTYLHVTIDSGTMTEDQAHVHAAGKLGISIKDLVPVRHFVHRNVEYMSDKGVRKKRVLEPRTDEHVNHLRPPRQLPRSDVPTLANRNAHGTNGTPRDRIDFVVGEFRDARLNNVHRGNIIVIASYKKTRKESR